MGVEELKQRIFHKKIDIERQEESLALDKEVLALMEETLRAIMNKPDDLLEDWDYEMTGEKND